MRRIYAQSKIRNDGATGAVYRFPANSIEEAAQRVREVIPTLITYRDAIGIVLNETNETEDEYGDRYRNYIDDPGYIADDKLQILLLKQGTDY